MIDETFSYQSWTAVKLTLYWCVYVNIKLIEQQKKEENIEKPQIEEKKEEEVKQPEEETKEEGKQIENENKEEVNNEQSENNIVKSDKKEEVSKEEENVEKVEDKDQDKQKEEIKCEVITRQFTRIKRRFSVLKCTPCQGLNKKERI